MTCSTEFFRVAFYRNIRTMESLDTSLVCTPHRIGRRSATFPSSPPLQGDGVRAAEQLCRCLCSLGQRGDLGLLESLCGVCWQGLRQALHWAPLGLWLEQKAAGGLGLHPEERARTAAHLALAHLQLGELHMLGQGSLVTVCMGL